MSRARLLVGEVRRAAGAAAEQDAPAEEGAPAEDAPVEGSEVPADHTSASTQDESFSSTMNMSKKGIFDQLTSAYGGPFTQEQGNVGAGEVLTRRRRAVLAPGSREPGVGRGSAPSPESAHVR
ncbi:hypothetical protein CFK38_04565 [Brachybacterium vulturis]|uniref:Putative host cell surface-exposed lipoprotein Ltp-like HTH region domain-containing protein n=1 Tax=Brachybacterium vulturis TaxID=2017484 RepID=A0A291GL12_9MICO|nr:hypothetical protein CFK38_04565 [Brachybacterium vulturis]